eukprot:6621461-Pyramimonas_sp.AAC.1
MCNTDRLPTAYCVTHVSHRAPGAYAHLGLAPPVRHLARPRGVVRDHERLIRVRRQLARRRRQAV